MLLRTKLIHPSLKFYVTFNATEAYYPTGNYLFKINHRNTRTRCEICSELRIIVNF